MTDKEEPKKEEESFADFIRRNVEQMIEMRMRRREVLPLKAINIFNQLKETIEELKFLEEVLEGGETLFFTKPVVFDDCTIDKKIASLDEVKEKVSEIKKYLQEIAKCQIVLW